MTHENPAARTAPDTTPEALLAGEPETLPDGGRIVFTKRKRSTVTTVLGAVVAGAVLFAGGVLTGNALGGDDTGGGRDHGVRGRRGRGLESRRGRRRERHGDDGR